MMRLWLIPVLLLGSVLLAAPAAGGDGSSGACLNVDEVYSGCIPNVTDQQCTDLYFWTDPVWNEGSDCSGLDLPFAWDGSCLAPIPIVGDRCMLLYTVPIEGATSQFHCEEEDGTWFADNLTCEGAPVPAMPQPALALMAFVILGAALAAMTSKAA